MPWLVLILSTKTKTKTRMNKMNDICATRIDYDTYYTVDPMNGRFIFASRMRDDYPCFDWCAGVAVIDLMSDEVVAEDVTIDRSHDKDVEALDVAYRALNAYQEADYYGTDESTVDIISKVCKRAGINLCFLNDMHYNYQVSDMSNDRVARYALIGDSAQDLAREFAAMANGYRWEIHAVNFATMLKHADLYDSEALDFEDFDYRGLSTDSVGGYTWENIADDGDSDPNVYELLYAI